MRPPCERSGELTHCRCGFPLAGNDDHARVGPLTNRPAVRRGRGRKPRPENLSPPTLLPPRLTGTRTSPRASVLLRKTNVRIQDLSRAVGKSPASRRRRGKRSKPRGRCLAAGPESCGWRRRPRTRRGRARPREFLPCCASSVRRSGRSPRTAKMPEHVRARQTKPLRPGGSDVAKTDQQALQPDPNPPSNGPRLQAHSSIVTMVPGSET